MCTKDVPKLTNKVLATIFVQFIKESTEDELKEYYANGIMNENELENIGKFRLMHCCINGNQFNNGEYFTDVRHFSFIAYFYENDGKKSLSVFSVDEDEKIMDCEFNPELKSWTDNFGNISRTDITAVSIKLKRVLE